MADGIKAVFNSQTVYIDINNTRISIRDEDKVLREVLLDDIRSLHVKSSEGYLLRLKLLEDSVVFEFESHHSRDVTKSILLSFMKSEQEILKRILDSDPTTRAVFNNLKQHMDASRFWEINRDKIRQLSSLVRQQPSREIDMEDKDFVSMLTPTLLKIFGQMNCSLTQFYNLMSQSYFCNIKNQKNSLDRMISTVVRDHEARQDFATRINSYSILALKPIESVEPQTSTKTGKRIEFLPVYPFEEAMTERLRRVYRFEQRPLVCSLELEIEPMVDRTVFDKKDLGWIRDLSRVVFKAAREGNKEFLEEAREVTRDFLEKMRKKHGSKVESLKRILPTYFIE